MLRINNYNNWSQPLPSDADYAEQLTNLAKHWRICMIEKYIDGIDMTVEEIKTLQTSGNVYALYTLCCLPSWDTEDLRQFPVASGTVDTNDWYLRDGNGDIVYESGTATKFIDVGKEGFKEEFTEQLLSRMEGKGFTGVVFDYWWANMISNHMDVPSATYPDDATWYTNAWQPFIDYAMDALVESVLKIRGMSSIK